MLIYVIPASGLGLALIAALVEAFFGQKSLVWPVFYAILGLLGAAIGYYIGAGNTSIVLENPFLNPLSLSLAVSALLVLCGLALRNRSGRADASPKRKQILISYFLVAALAVVAAMFFHIPITGADLIKAEIEQANYCQSDADCAQLAGQCPFGCYVYVNKQEAERIDEMVSSYDSYCIYGCTEAPAYGCENDRCVPYLGEQADSDRPANDDFVKDIPCDGGPDVCLNEGSETSSLDTNEVSGFEQCVRAGNPVMESHPRKCRMDGVTYTEPDYQTGDLLNTSCEASADCGPTPFEFAVMSNCPYGTACIDGNCAVVCAMAGHNADSSVCATDNDCDCGDWDESGLFPCECADGKCASVVAAKKIFRELLASKHDWDTDLVRVSLTNMSASHAHGIVKFYMEENGELDGGGYFFAARTGKGWEIVLDGNGQIPCETLAEYQFPESFRTQCVE